MMATWPSGKAGVCKTPIAGSNPAVASLLGFILIVKANHYFVVSLFIYGENYLCSLSRCLIADIV